MRRTLPALFLLLALPIAARAQTLTVFAAASLTNAMQDVGRLWVKAGHPALRLSFASSSTLARQIEQGAPVDLFASADLRWMNDLQAHGLVAAATRRDLLGNTLVLVVPAAHPVRVTIGPRLDLRALLGPQGRLALGDPGHVPAGIYAKQALTHLGLWASVRDRLAPAENVRAALLLVERAETPAGIVYGTDAAVAPNVAVAGVFPADSHKPIVYPFALTKHGDAAEGKALMTFLEGAQARAVFEHYGFRVEGGDPHAG